MKHSVYIDGIKYIPASDSPIFVDSKKFVYTLLEQYWGGVTDEDYEKYDMGNLRVLISDCGDWFKNKEGWTIQELFEHLADMEE